MSIKDTGDVPSWASPQPHPRWFGVGWKTENGSELKQTSWSVCSAMISLLPMEEYLNSYTANRIDLHGKIEQRERKVLTGQL